MIKVSFIKPFYTKLSNKSLRMVFAYQYLAIEKDDELFHFIPIESKEIIYDIHRQQVENKNEVFVFQRGNRFVRMKIHELLEVEGVKEAMDAILEEAGVNEIEKKVAVGKMSKFEKIHREEELDGIMKSIYEMNIKNELNAQIEVALEQGDKVKFMELTEKFKKQIN